MLEVQARTDKHACEVAGQRVDEAETLRIAAEERAGNARRKRKEAEERSAKDDLSLQEAFEVEQEYIAQQAQAISAAENAKGVMILVEERAFRQQQQCSVAQLRAQKAKEAWVQANQHVRFSPCIQRCVCVYACVCVCIFPLVSVDEAKQLTKKVKQAWIEAVEQG